MRGTTVEGLRAVTARVSLSHTFGKKDLGKALDMINAINRRDMLARTAQASLMLVVGGAVATAEKLLAADSAPAVPRFRIGACDWSIGKMGKADGLDLAKKIGLDGLQVSLGTAADDMRLRKAEAQEEYREATRRSGAQVASLAIGELNNIPYKKDPRTIEWVADSVDACKALNVNVVLLAFFGEGDLRGDKAGIDEVVKRLKAVAPQAEKAGVILGIESWLSAEQHVEILDRVGSNAVQVYYDVCNSHDRGYDIYKEIRMLGSKRICEFHAKENGVLLGKGNVDFRKVRDAMDAIQYRGWIQIEGAIPPGGAVLDSYKANCEFLRGIFA